MYMRILIAFRNVLRNPRRTTLNILMIAGGMCAIIVYRGFIQNLLDKLENVTINTQYSHIQIASEKTWHLSANDLPKDRLVHFEPELLQKIDAVPGVAYASPRLSFFGLISAGERSLSARAVSYDPAVELQMNETMRILKGRKLNMDSRFEILLGSGLQEQIGVNVGDSVSLLAVTIDGSVNAVDSEVVGIYQSGFAEVDNTTFFTSLFTAQKLMDTDLVENMIIQLNRTSDTPRILKEIQPLAPPGTSAKPWYELAVSYKKLVEFNYVQALIITWIIMLLALLAIANTVGMSISERIGEIGTVRAMGDSRADVIFQFLMEGIALGVLGGIAGCIFGVCGAFILTWLKIPINVPGASLPLLVEVNLLPSAFLESFGLTCLMSVIATLVPAYRGSKVKITEALKRNI